MGDQVRVFVSHHRSPTEDAFTRRLVADLQVAGADVWLDTERIPSGDFVSKINEGLAGRQWLVLVMTPDAIKSSWVRAEVNAALSQVNAGRMLGVIPVVAVACDESDIPLLWANLQRYDATRDYQTAVVGLLRALGVTAPGQVPVIATPVPPVTVKKLPAHQSRRGIVLSVVSILLVVVVVSTLFVLGILHIPGSQTAVSPQNLYRQITSGQPLVSDPLTSPTENLWDSSASCSFTQGAYYITISQADRTSECYDNFSTYSNSLFRATVSITSGDSAGLVFRATDTSGPRYRFAVYQNGNYNLVLASTQYQATPLISGVSSLIRPGANTLSVIATGNTIDLFINDQFVKSYTVTSDAAPTLGKIGVFAYEATAPTVAAFSNVQLWSM
jgi:TIR domain